MLLSVIFLYSARHCRFSVFVGVPIFTGSFESVQNSN